MKHQSGSNKLNTCKRVSGLIFVPDIVTKKTYNLAKTLNKEKQKRFIDMYNRFDKYITTSTLCTHKCFVNRSLHAIDQMITEYLASIPEIRESIDPFLWDVELVRNDRSTDNVVLLCSVCTGKGRIHGKNEHGFAFDCNNVRQDIHYLSKHTLGGRLPIKVIRAKIKPRRPHGFDIFATVLHYYAVYLRENN